ncbi:DMT family transporter [Calothrix rhizosoleniae]|uniref:DMT family transporter n=1 Tax=Calothrix rhizosoleniae TaxID=888997 RepID=UPI000B49D0BB|nr:DMT family transporter [Calothrix rhizosoleniae]
MRKGANTIFYIPLNLVLTDIKGEMAALCGAALWAVASLVYGRLGKNIAPLHLNLLKGAIAIALLLITIYFSGGLIPDIAPISIFLLLVSGLMGIALGDTAFFVAINSLGVRRALLMGTLVPPITAIAAMIFLQERLNMLAWWGIFITILGVAWVISERVAETENNYAHHLIKGISYGLLAAIANTIGALLSRVALANTTVTPIWAALLRLIGGELVLLGWLYLPQQPSNFQWQILYSRRAIAGIFFAAFIGTYLGIWLQVTAIKFTQTGIATTLLQTSPLFAIPLAMWMGEKVSWRAIAGVLVSLGGVALFFYSK